MRQLRFQIPESYQGRKLLHFLRGEAGCSSAQVTRLKKYEDGILLNGRHARTIDRLCAGDMLVLTLRETQPVRETSATGSAPLLYEDGDLLIFDKPAGMPCHPSRGHQDDTLANAFAALMQACGVSLPFRAINRLDRDTTGAVAVAKSAYAACVFQRRLHKQYLAVIHGALSPASGTIEAPILRLQPYDIRRGVHPDGQYARTDYETLRVYDTQRGRYSLVRCTLPTGRTHQIRVHMAHLGHPLVGDTLYGTGSAYISRQALHCAVLEECPKDGRTGILVRAPVPKDMQKLFASLVES